MDNVRSTAIVHLRKVQLRKTVSLNAEALAAAALALDVGVAELERLVEPVFDEVDLGAVDELQAIGRHDDLYPPLLEHDVALGHAVRVIDRIGPAVAAATPHSDAESHAATALLEIRAHADRRTLRQRNRHSVLTFVVRRGNKPPPRPRFAATSRASRRVLRARRRLPSRRACALPRPGALRATRPRRSPPPTCADNQTPETLPPPRRRRQFAAGSAPRRAACGPRPRPPRDPGYQPAVPAPFSAPRSAARRPGCIP